MLDCFFVDSDKTVCIVMELLAGQSLYDLVRTGRQLSRYDDVAWSSDEEENKTEKVVTPDHISVGQVKAIMKQVLVGLK